MPLLKQQIWEGFHRQRISPVSTQVISKMRDSISRINSYRWPSRSPHLVCVSLSPLLVASRRHFDAIDGSNKTLRTEMYLVVLAGSVPPLSPFFTKHFGKSSTRRYYGTNNVSQGGDITSTSSTVPQCRTKTYASAANKNSSSNPELDSTENILGAMAHGDILMTTRINVSRGSSILHKETEER